MTTTTAPGGPMIATEQEVVTNFAHLVKDETATLPGLGRKLAQLRYGLRGEIPDGLLFRVSSFAAIDEQPYELQNQFLNDLSKNMSAGPVPRYYGKSNQTILASSTHITLIE